MNELTQLIQAADYARSKLLLIPAFGDEIGVKVSKAELGVALHKLTAALVRMAHNQIGRKVGRWD